MKIKTVILCICTLLLLISYVSADDWHMFRHDPAHTGATSDTVKPSGKPLLILLWHFETGSSVRSSPAVYDGLVYIGSDDGCVYALDAMSGNLKWRYKTGSAVSSSPAVSEGLVYINSQEGSVYALDVKNGKLKWTYQIGLYYTGSSLYSSPAVADGIVYVGSSDGCVYALDAKNGDLKWKHPIHSYSSFIDKELEEDLHKGIISRELKNMFKLNGLVLSENSTVKRGEGNLKSIIVDEENGMIHEIWKEGVSSATLHGNTYFSPLSVYTRNSIYSSPALFGGTVYVKSGYFYALDAKNGGSLWKYNMGQGSSSSPTISNGMVYIGSNAGYVYALDAKNGDLLWKYNTGSPIYTSPAVADSIVYVASWASDVYALDAKNGDLLWKSHTGAGSSSSPAISNGMVFIGADDGYVYALDATNGDLKWKYKTDDRVESSPAVSNGIVYVGSWDGGIYAFMSPYPFAFSSAQSAIDSANKVGADTTQAQNMLNQARTTSDLNLVHRAKASAERARTTRLILYGVAVFLIFLSSTFASVKIGRRKYEQKIKDRVLQYKPQIEQWEIEGFKGEILSEFKKNWLK